MSCENQMGGKGDEGNGSDRAPPLPVVVVVRPTGIGTL